MNRLTFKEGWAAPDSSEENYRCWPTEKKSDRREDHGKVVAVLSGTGDAACLECALKLGIVTKDVKRSHKNDRRRITARERATAWFTGGGHLTIATLTRVLEAHAAATLARHRAKLRKPRTRVDLSKLARDSEPALTIAFRPEG